MMGREVSDDRFSWRPNSNKQEDYERNGLNQYTTVDAVAKSYDDNGSMINTGEGWTYAYDIEIRLVCAQEGGPSDVSWSLSGGCSFDVFANGTTKQVTYAYDVMGRRASTTVTDSANTNTTYYLNDGTEEIADFDASGNILRRYVNGVGVDERLAYYEYSVSTGAEIEGKYYHVNWQGSVIAMSDGTSGDLTEIYSYDEFGIAKALDANGVELDPLTGNPFRYTGRRLDFESGLYYYRARYYSAELGRFLQVDPIGYEDNMNLYAYVGNDPVNNTDPSGKCPGCPTSLRADNSKPPLTGPKAKAEAAFLNETLNPVEDIKATANAIADGDFVAAGMSAMSVVNRPAKPFTKMLNPKALKSIQSKSEMTGNQVKRMTKDMKANGFDQSKPVSVSEGPDGSHFITDGHHRTAAAQKAGIKEIPAEVTKVDQKTADKLKEAHIEARCADSTKC